MPLSERLSVKYVTENRGDEQYASLQVAISRKLCFAGILEQSMGARNRVGIGLLYLPARLHRLCGIDSLESIPGLLKSLKNTGSGEGAT